MLNIASINQDRGISPQRTKGAAVHLSAMRKAFSDCGAHVTAIDEPDHQDMREALERTHAGATLDLVYERYALGCCAGAEFAMHHGIPLVLEVNAPLAEEAARHRGVRESHRDRSRDRTAFQAATLVVAVSTQVAEYAQERGAKREHIIICPNGIATDRFHPGVTPDAARRAGVPDDAFVIGFHGRERPWHGFNQLVSVVRSLLDRDLPIHLLVAGEGNFEALSSLPKDRFTHVGWQPHEKVPGFVAAFDALPLTYAADAPCYFSPLKLAEAMACGVVPIVPDIGDLPSQVRHGHTGIVYPASDWKRLEAALAELASDDGLRNRLGDAAARFAAGLGWDRIAQRVLDATSAGIRRVAGSG